MNIKTALNWASSELSNIHDTAQLDAEILLSKSLNKNRSYLYTWPEKHLNTTQLKQFQEFIRKRKSGIPIAYLLGQKEFWSLNFIVTADTLIPRPETEHLVEQALELIPKQTSWKVVDLGTGSGAIALAIASERCQCQISACDKSSAALDIALKNAHNNKLNNISFIQSDWFEALVNQQFNIIISNPPYVAAHDPLLTQGDVRFEPVSALQSGTTGLDDIKKIIKQATNFLLNDGWLLLEHGFEQHQAVQELFKHYQYQNITTKNDLSGQARITFAQIASTN
ncbi:Peptide chain release factor N(5)-glutamine methyltransferase [hydrothermal vent metagenome]|uniref:peptide chain release factor N(5)-glutamine methyltransferase n=1 Tax=hydrothermal vent metagenome TaxID=652676 RepID=A0A3B0ZRD0_9ZZZZ